VTTASATVKNLFANGVQMTLARFPNKGFLPIATTPTTTTLTASAINQPGHSWDGANIRVRTANWEFENRTVTYDGITLTLTRAPDVRMAAGWGFYLDNKLAALDTAGEWYCDPATNSVYFWAPGGVDPSTMTVEGSVLDYGVNSSQSNITVQGLEFRCQAQAALWFSLAASNIQILSNKISGSLITGILCDGWWSASCTIDGNTIQDVNGIGIFNRAPRSTISNNTVKRINMVQGYGQGGNQQVVGILSNGSNCTISGNVVDSIGYCGIIAQGEYSLVENNVVTNSMLFLADGGGIYAYGASSITIRNNVISDVVGNVDGAPAPDRSWPSAHGIYLDYGCHDFLIEGNTIIRAASDGMFVNYAGYGNTLRNNVLYDCARNSGTYFIQVDQNTTLNYGQNVIKRNIIYPGDITQKMVLIQEWTGGVLHSPGIIDSNYYCNPYGDATPFKVYLVEPNLPSRYSLEAWKTATGQDVHSAAGSQTLSGQGSGSKGKVKGPSSTTNQAAVYVNSTAQQKTVNLGSESFRDLDGNPVSGSVNLAPFSSKILIKDSTQAKKATPVGKEGSMGPEDFNLYQNYPNPFNPSTQIRYALPIEAKVRLEVYDLTGRRISILVDEDQTAGYHDVRFDGSRMASGTYFYRLQAGSYSATKKFTFLK
jgi:parallel beta-helix repeat protein